MSILVKNSYRSIFSSSALMGSQQFVLLLVGVVQAKAVAVLVGSAGIGVFGIYGTLLVFVQSFFGFGLVGSGVREIAARKGEPGEPPPEDVIRVLQGISIGSAVLGAVALIGFQRLVRQWAPGGEYSLSAIVFIAIALVASQWSNSQLAVFQGLRRIRTLMITKSVAAVLSAISVVILVFWLGSQGIAPAYASSSLCLLLVSWLFFRKLKRVPESLSLTQWRIISIRLMTLGMGFMASSLFAAASAYVVRSIIGHVHGIAAVGLFQAAWMLTTFYAAVVLQAMGTDFLPRLSAASRDRNGLCQLSNEQIEAGLILVIPGLTLCYLFAPQLLQIFYTAEFLPAVSLARWMLLGMMVRAAGWPLAYIPLALSRPGVTAITEAVFNGLLIILTMIGVRRFGLEGAGMAYLISSIVYMFVLFGVAHRMIGFTWSRSALRIQGLLYASAILVAVLLFFFTGLWGALVAYILTAGLCILCGIWAFRTLELVTFMAPFLARLRSRCDFMMRRRR